MAALLALSLLLSLCQMLRGPAVELLRWRDIGRVQRCECCECCESVQGELEGGGRDAHLHVSE